MTPEPLRVLFVDDNRLMAEALARRLAMEPDIAFVGWAENAGEAPQAAAATRTQVMVLDVDMPGDSFELVRSLSREAPSIKVVMFSGHVHSDYIDRSIDAGAWGYISKHESMEVVIDAIRRIGAGEFVLSPDVESMRRIE